MANYKPYGTNLLSYGGVTRPFSKSDEIKILILDYNLASTPNTFEDLTTGAVYSVPSGKTFTAYGFIAEWNAIVGTWTIHQGDTEDAQTTLKFTIIRPATKETIEYPFDLEFASGKFIVLDSSAANTGWTFMLIGIET